MGLTVTMLILVMTALIVVHHFIKKKYANNKILPEDDEIHELKELAVQEHPCDMENVTPSNVENVTLSNVENVTPSDVENVAPSDAKVESECETILTDFVQTMRPASSHSRVATTVTVEDMDEEEKMSTDNNQKDEEHTDDKITPEVTKAESETKAPASPSSAPVMPMFLAPVGSIPNPSWKTKPMNSQDQPPDSAHNITKPTKDPKHLKNKRGKVNRKGPKE